MDVFDVFKTSPYTFLTVRRGGVYGNTIEASTEAQGVFKLRNGMIVVNNQESYGTGAQNASATLHVKPSESFANDEMIGNGIRHNGLDYEITGQTGGYNFETGVLEHYRLTLERTDYAELEETS